jgi:PIN domain nuclease of toxin-antitoxin system
MSFIAGLSVYDCGSLQLEDNLLLNSKVKTAITNGRNQIYVSAVSTWETSIKKALGKLEAPDDLDSIVEDERFLKLPISLYHGQIAGQLPGIHRDPFDRMLVAQAQVEGLVLVTGDPHIMKYSVKLMNAK